jgi:hypothetical protein
MCYALVSLPEPSQAENAEAEKEHCGGFGRGDNLLTRADRHIVETEKIRTFFRIAESHSCEKTFCVNYTPVKN